MRIFTRQTLLLAVCMVPFCAQAEVTPQNKKILDYIGEPITYKTKSRDYAPETMLAEFKAACKKSKAKVSVVKIDTTEYPYLIYGTWQESSKGTELRPILAAHKPEIYSFQGSVGGSTNFAVNITPYRAHPPELIGRIIRRTGIRMSVLCESLKSK